MLDELFMCDSVRKVLCQDCVSLTIRRIMGHAQINGLNFNESGEIKIFPKIYQQTINNVNNYQ